MHHGEALPGYEYDPDKMKYVRTPTAAGQRVSQYLTAALGGLLGGGGLGGIGGGFLGSGGAGGTGGGGYVSPIQPPDMTSANAATFARAKDKAGQLARAGLQSLQGELGAQGMLGGGAQAQATRDIVQTGMGQVGDVSRQQAIEEAAQKAKFAELGYTGGITQRGQDIQLAEAQARLAAEERARQFDVLKLVLSGLGGALGGGEALY
jgi:hypothetical protein